MFFDSIRETRALSDNMACVQWFGLQPKPEQL